MTIPSAFPNPITEAIGALYYWWSSQRIPYTLIGGVAVSLVAEPRVTKDIDAVVWLEAERWPEFVDSGTSYGFVPEFLTRSISPGFTGFFYSNTNPAVWILTFHLALYPLKRK